MTSLSSLVHRGQRKGKWPTLVEKEEEIFGRYKIWSSVINPWFQARKHPSSLYSFISALPLTPLLPSPASSSQICPLCSPSLGVGDTPGSIEDVLVKLCVLLVVGRVHSVHCKLDKDSVQSRLLRMDHHDCIRLARWQLLQDRRQYTSPLISPENRLFIEICGTRYDFPTSQIIQ